MAAFPRLPDLPSWVPYPLVVWFVVEGVALGLVGFAVRDLLGPAVPGAVTVGNVVIFVGTLTAIGGTIAFLVLVAANR